MDGCLSRTNSSLSSSSADPENGGQHVRRRLTTPAKSASSFRRPLLFTHAQASQKSIANVRPDPSVVPPDSGKHAEIVALARMYDVVMEKIKTNRANHLNTKELEQLQDFILYQNEKVLQADKEPTDRGQFASEYTEVKRTYNDLLGRIEFDITHYRSGLAKLGWDAIAGWMAFALCFGPGTLTSAALQRVYPSMAALAVIMIGPTVWTVTERLVPMIRATSWINPHADATYPLFMKLQERRARDWVRSWRPGLAAKQKTYAWKNPGTGAMESLTAAQYRNKISICKAWLGKVWTDDLPYFWYTLSYGGRVSLLYRYATPAALGRPLSLPEIVLTMFLAGGLAGAATMVTMQQARRLAYKRANGDASKDGEVLVKSRDIWTAATITTQKDIALVKKKYLAVTDPREGVALNAYRACLEAELKKAERKSSRLASIGYELSPLLQKKRHTGDAKGEVAGKRIETASGWIGKHAALLPSVLFMHYVIVPYLEKGEQVPEHLLWIQYTLLIVGFMWRKEFEILGRVPSGWLYGMADLIQDCRGKADPDDIVTEIPVQSYKDEGHDGDIPNAGVNGTPRGMPSVSSPIKSSPENRFSLPASTSRLVSISSGTGNGDSDSDSDNDAPPDTAIDLRSIMSVASTSRNSRGGGDRSAHNRYAQRGDDNSGESSTSQSSAYDNGSFVHQQPQPGHSSTTEQSSASSSCSESASKSSDSKSSSPQSDSRHAPDSSE